jgi:hypothetical protein
MGVNQYGINPIITIATGVAFILQFNTTADTRGASAMNRMTLLLPTLIFLALAVSWPFRFKVPQIMRDLFRGDVWLLEEWYPLVGWTCVNNAIIAIGHAVMLYAASGRARGGVIPEGERQALLNR